MNKFLIIGTGGVGGSIAGFLALAGKDVTCIARGKHLEAIREKGLHLKSDLKGEHYLPVKACTAEEYNEQADVIFVCVKGYSINSIQDVLERASHQDTLVIPILNVYGTGPEQEIAPERLEAVANALRDAGIKADISEDINRDTFIKWSFISAMAFTGAYHNVPMGALQHPGEERDTFIGLSRESSEMGRRMGIIFPEDPIEYNLKVIDKLDPDSTASMQKDIAKGHESEIQGLLFDMIALGEKMDVDMPTYRKVAQKFKI